MLRTVGELRIIDKNLRYGTFPSVVVSPLADLQASVYDYTAAFFTITADKLRRLSKADALEPVRLLCPVLIL